MTSRKHTTYTNANINSASFRLDTDRPARATETGIAAIEPATLARLYRSNKTAAAAALAALTESQLVIEAIDYAVWLESQGKVLPWGRVLATFEELIESQEERTADARK